MASACPPKKPYVYVSRDITVDNLRHADMPTICVKVESLCFHTGRSHSCPSQVLFLELCIRSLLCLLGYRLNCGRSIDRLLGPSNVCCPDSLAIGRIVTNSCSETYCCLIQFMFALVGSVLGVCVCWEPARTSATCRAKSTAGRAVVKFTNSDSRTRTSNVCQHPDDLD